MLSCLRLRAIPSCRTKALQLCTAAQNAGGQQPTTPSNESRWQRLKRMRRAAPTPTNRTKHEYDRSQTYQLPEALTHVRASQWAKFDESLELVLRLNIDPRKADQNLRGSITLPHGTGRPDKVVVFAEDEHADSARSAGADLVGADSLIDQIKADKGKSVKGFAAAVSVPHLLPSVASRIGRILGPKGVMPSEKTNTVTSDVADVVRRIKRGWLCYRTDKDGNVHLNVGRLSFSDEQLIENVAAAVKGILDVRPAAVKKKFVKKVVVSSSMGPSVELNLESIAKTAFAIPEHA